VVNQNNCDLDITKKQNQQIDFDKGKKIMTPSFHRIRRKVYNKGEKIGTYFFQLMLIPSRRQMYVTEADN